MAARRLRWAAARLIVERGSIWCDGEGVFAETRISKVAAGPESWETCQRLPVGVTVVYTITQMVQTYSNRCCCVRTG